jgi:hypothetical protein
VLERGLVVCVWIEEVRWLYCSRVMGGGVCNQYESHLVSMAAGSNIFAVLNDQPWSLDAYFRLCCELMHDGISMK